MNDFRKLCGIETYGPVDNISELTARTNDEGWDSVFAAWLDTSQLGEKDALLIYSVGGGDAERKISANIVQAIDLAKARSAKVFGIVGRDSVYTAKHGDVVVLIPQVNPSWVTPLTEAFPGRGVALPGQPSSLAAQADEMVSPAHGLRPAVFLDRNGVIVVPEFRDRRSFAPRRLQDFRLYPEAAASLQKLKRAGFLLTVVTNQPDVGNGLMSRSEVEAMHEIKRRELPLDAIKVCFHGQVEGCDCRKQKPGMISRGRR